MAGTTRSSTAPPRRTGAAARRLFLTPAVCALVVALATACGSTGDTTSASSSSSALASTAGSPAAVVSSMMPATATEIMIENFEYAVPASVSPGATVSVMNMDAEAHTVTADTGGAFDVKAVPGSTATFTAPTTPGTYAFHCTYHSTMHGVLVVQ